MKSPMQAAFDGITHEQAGIVWELLSGFVEDAEINAGESDFDAICPPAKIEAARALREALDAAHVRFSEEN